MENTIRGVTASDGLQPAWDNIPQSLADRQQWLLWRYEAKEGQAKPLKVPYWATGTRRGGTQGSDNDRANLVTLAQARTCYERGNFTGVGFAFLPDDGLIGIDIDGAIDSKTGEVSERLQAIISAVNSYTEYSPSGKGAHIITQGETVTNKSNDIGLEVFCGRQYFTFTGKHWAGTPLTVEPIDAQVLRRLNCTVDAAKAKRKTPTTTPQAATNTAGLRARVESALEALNPDLGYNDWIAIGWALREAFGDFGFGLWNDWSARGAKYAGENDLQSHWKSFTCSRAPDDAVGVIFARARDAGWKASKRETVKIGADMPAWDYGAFDDVVPEDDAKPSVEASPLAPPVMPTDAFPGLLGAIVQASTVNSEAHPVAVAANVLAMFCCAVGRVPFQRIGDATIHARPFLLIVGKSGKARKGTAEHTPREIFRRADARLRQLNGNDDRLRVHAGGLSTGEGVGYAIRDPREPDEKTGKGGDAGVHDKRLLVIESEFANVLAQIKREGNILSSTLRNLWDGRDIEPLTKSTLMTVTRPHVAVIGHITGHELREKSSENDAANGLLNRFVILHVHRPRLVPLPTPTPEQVLDDLAARLADVINAVTSGNPHANNQVEVTLSDSAAQVWCELYPQITEDHPGKAGSLMARSEVYARMLAMVFALLDKRTVIEPDDLLTALEWIKYWTASIQYTFLTGEQQDGLDEFTKAVLAAVAQRPGITLTELQKVWHRHRIDEVKKSLETLLNSAPPLVEMRKDNQAQGGGRAAQRYYIVRT